MIRVFDHQLISDDGFRLSAEQLGLVLVVNSDALCKIIFELDASMSLSLATFRLSMFVHCDRRLGVFELVGMNSSLYDVWPLAREIP